MKKDPQSAGSPSVSGRGDAVMRSRETWPVVRCLHVIVVGLRSCTAAFAIMVLFIVLLTACSPSQVEDNPTTESVLPSSQAPSKGRELFAANCAVCHGVAAEGQPDWHIKKADGTLPAPPLSGDGHTWHHSDGLLYRIVSQGGQTLEDPSFPGFKSGMPAFEDRLSHEEIVDVLTYVRSLWEGKTSRGLSIQESQALASEQDPFPPGKK